jgi:methyl-accepting chemotaxis protein
MTAPLRPPPPSLRACAALLLASALLLAPRGAGATGDAAASPAVLEGREGWRYRWGDSPVGPDGLPAWAAESGEGPGWEPAVALKAPPGREGRTFLWLSIPVPPGDWAEPALLMGAVTSAYEVYAGGRRVHAAGEVRPEGREVNAYLGWQLVRVPRASVGGRVLLRAQSHGATIGVERDFRVGNRHELFLHALRPVLGAYALGLLLLGLSAVAALAFALQRRERLLLALAGFSFSAGLLLTGLSGVGNLVFGTGGRWFVLQLVGVWLVNPFLCHFVERAVLQGRRPWLRRGIPALYAVGLAGALLALAAPLLAQRLLPLAMLLTTTGVFVSCAVSALEAWRGDADARLVAAGLAALLASTVLTALRGVGVDVAGFVLHWGLGGLTLALLAVLARRAVQVQRTLGAHARALEARQEQVQGLVATLTQGAGQLAAAVQQLQAAGGRQGEGLARQAVALQETQTTVEEIRQTSRMTAEKARALADSAGEAERVGREGTAALERSVEGLAAIHTAVAATSARVGALEARAKEIASIVDAVKNLADQSNMLALNAAIEAVRSGEHGKGFSVVAREVRNLADQSIDATERIREVLDSVGAGIREAVKLSGEGEAQVHRSLEQVRASGEQLRQLVAFVGDTGASVRQISAATAQQDAGTSQMAVAIADLSEQMQQTLRALAQTEQATRSVQALAGGMSQAATTPPLTATATATAPPTATA